jgi:hypothetical protein
MAKAKEIGQTFFQRQILATKSPHSAGLVVD